MQAKNGQGVKMDRIKALADVLSDQLLPVHNPVGHAQAVVEVACWIDLHPTLLRTKAAKDYLGKQRLVTLRAVPKFDRVVLPDSQRQAVKAMRALTTRVLEHADMSPATAVQIVAIHRAFAGSTHYDVNLGPKRAAVAQAFLEPPSRRRRRKVNPTPQLSALGIGEATERVKREVDALLGGEGSRNGGIAARARRVQLIAELVGIYPQIVERDYLRRKLGTRRLERIDALFV